MQMTIVHVRQGRQPGNRLERIEAGSERFLQMTKAHGPQGRQPWERVERIEVGLEWIVQKMV